MVAHRMKNSKTISRKKRKSPHFKAGAIYVTLTAIKRKIRLSLREKSHKIEMMIKTQECFLKAFYYFLPLLEVFFLLLLCVQKKERKSRKSDPWYLKKIKTVG